MSAARVATPGGRNVSPESADAAAPTTEVTNHHLPPVGVFTCSHCGRTFGDGQEVWVGWYDKAGQWLTTGVYHDGCVPRLASREGDSGPDDLRARIREKLRSAYNDALYNGLDAEHAFVAAKMHLDAWLEVTLAASRERAAALPPTLEERCKHLLDRTVNATCEDVRHTWGVYCRACPLLAAVAQHDYEPRDCGGACLVCGCGKSAHRAAAPQQEKRTP